MDVHSVFWFRVAIPSIFPESLNLITLSVPGSFNLIPLAIPEKLQTCHIENLDECSISWFINSFPQIPGKFRLNILSHSLILLDTGNLGVHSVFWFSWTFLIHSRSFNLIAFIYTWFSNTRDILQIHPFDRLEPDLVFWFSSTSPSTSPTFPAVYALVFSVYNYIDHLV